MANIFEADNLPLVIEHNGTTVVVGGASINADGDPTIWVNDDGADFLKAQGYGELLHIKNDAPHMVFAKFRKD